MELNNPIPKGHHLSPPRQQPLHLSKRVKNQVHFLMIEVTFEEEC